MADDGSAQSETTGHSGDAIDFQPLLYGCRIVGAAWDLAKLRTPVPTVEALLRFLPDALRTARSLLRGRPTQVTSVVSLTGIRLPEGTEISGTWGRIRPVRAEDHPSFLKPKVEKRTTTTTEAGDQIEISDAGDVIFEASIAMTMKINRDGYKMSWSTSSPEEVAITDRLRLAFALTVKRETRPVLLVAWQKTIMPLVGSPVFDMDPQFMASRVPTLLSTAECTEWESWINVVMAADLSAMSVAVTRTLRAQTERRDASDALIDAVIAWESLFGAVTESTLRVSASLARLLHPSGPEREQARNRYRTIYDHRSKIVHGTRIKFTPEQIQRDSWAAIDASFESIRMLLATRSDLLMLGSAERSMQILLNDHHGG